MNEWYFSVDNITSGPYTLSYAKAFAREHQSAYCWQQGMPDWIPLFEATAIRPMKKDGVTPFPPLPANMLSPKPTLLPIADETDTLVNTPSAVRNVQASNGFGQQLVTEGIDYKIYGHETQFVEIELDANESAVAEAGAMMYKSPEVKMETVFGDGSSNQEAGIMGLLLGAGKRLLTNESLFITVFTQTAQRKGRVAFAAPFPGTILALNLKDYDRKLICQKDSFLAAAKGVQVGIQFQRRILTGLFGGEGFVMQKLEGEGWVFIHAGGCLQKIELNAGETLHVDTGCLAAMTGGIDFDIQKAGGIKTMLFGGEGLFFAVLTGPGTVWLQSLPFSRLAGRMLSAAPQGGGRQQDEGSILGGLGNLLGGD
ncbi:MAG: TIGR00266 family protein [Methylococcales bacterium]